MPATDVHRLAAPLSPTRYRPALAGASEILGFDRERGPTI